MKIDKNSAMEHWIKLVLNRNPVLYILFLFLVQENNTEDEERDRSALLR